MDILKVDIKKIISLFNDQTVIYRNEGSENFDINFPEELYYDKDSNVFFDRNTGNVYEADEIIEAVEKNNISIGDIIKSAENKLEIKRTDDVLTFSIKEKEKEKEKNMTAFKIKLKGKLSELGESAGFAVAAVYNLIKKTGAELSGDQKQVIKTLLNDPLIILREKNETSTSIMIISDQAPKDLPDVIFLSSSDKRNNYMAKFYTLQIFEFIKANYKKKAPDNIIFMADRPDRRDFFKKADEIEDELWHISNDVQNKTGIGNLEDCETYLEYVQEVYERVRKEEEEERKIKKEAEKEGITVEKKKRLLGLERKTTMENIRKEIEKRKKK